VNSKLQAGELAAWIRVEDLQVAILRVCLSHRVEAEVRGQRIGESPRQHSATRPVEDGEEIHEASTHGNVDDIRGSDVVGANDVQTAQEIGVYPMGRMLLRGAGRAIHGGDAPAAHQCGHRPPPDGVPLVPEQIAQHPGASKRIPQMQLVNPPHQCEHRI